MTIKLLLLKSGEEVVSDVKEMVVEEKVVGYILHYPARARIISDNGFRDGMTNSPHKLQLMPWMPMSKDKVIPIVSDWVISITEPVDQLVQMYKKGIEDHEIGKSTSSDSDEREGDSDSD